MKGIQSPKEAEVKRDSIVNSVSQLATSRVLTEQERAWIGSEVLQSFVVDFGHKTKGKRAVTMQKMAEYFLQVSKVDRSEVDPEAASQLIEDGMDLFEAISMEEA